MATSTIKKIKTDDVEMTTTVTGYGYTISCLKRGSIGQVAIYSGTASSNISGGATIATLPEGFRPKFQQMLPVAVGSSLGRLNIIPDGIINCTIQIPSGTSLRFSAVILIKEE